MSVTNKLEGTVENVIYHNEENGYTVFTIRAENIDDFDEITTCTGYISAPVEGENLQLAGNFVHNPRYGRQLAITRVERTRPNTLAGIEKYLASGVIKGIGAKTAKMIVAKFGKDTFDIIENEPAKLARLKGISLKKAISFSESFHAQADLRRIMLFLQEYGISSSFAMKIYKLYKEETVELIRLNPYKLAEDIDGIGFKTADAIAHKLGISRDAPERISAGVRYALWEASNEGHTCIPVSQLTAQAAELLFTSPELIDNELVRMQMERLIVREKFDNDQLVFLSTLYYAEKSVAAKLSHLSALNITTARAEEHTNFALEKETGIKLSDGQRYAVAAALSHGVLIITGGPGTGKTTTINTIIGLLESKGLQITLAAPTGRAAKRMTEATGREAKTIHRLLEVTFISEHGRRQIFQRNEENPLETDVLIVDESSMMDIQLTHSLLNAVATGTRLILVGDVDQLPSVGPGNVLKDLIESGTLATARLTEVFRQAAESAIITNAHLINKGEYPAINDKEKDFFFVRRQSPDDVVQTLLNLVSERLPAYKNFDPRYDIQVLSPMRKSPLGVMNLNNLLQATLNPPSKDKKEREFRTIIFREGDKVMQIRNNYDASWQLFDEKGFSVGQGQGVFNGDMGTIYEIDNEFGMTVAFDDGRRIVYDFMQLDELELAYAVTVHKAQGSEYKVVVIPVYSGPPMLLTRNLLYTAVTRAKELAVLVGTPETMHRMIDNNRITHRYTALARRLRDMYGVML
ncbi:MAG: ATP-dependent RecD-like DNA helicase [Firmicutes bacterium]|nr:ATP-dependent RecD-like DNA helicase [Bacillota bacterium]